MYWWYNANKDFPSRKSPAWWTLLSTCRYWRPDPDWPNNLWGTCSIGKGQFLNGKCSEVSPIKRPQCGVYYHGPSCKYCEYEIEIPPPDCPWPIEPTYYKDIEVEELNETGRE